MAECYPRATTAPMRQRERAKSVAASTHVCRGRREGTDEGERGGSIQSKRMDGCVRSTDARTGSTEGVDGRSDGGGGIHSAFQHLGESWLAAALTPSHSDSNTG